MPVGSVVAGNPAPVETLRIELGAANAPVQRFVHLPEYDAAATWPDGTWALPDSELVETLRSVVLAANDERSEAVHDLLVFAEEHSVFGTDPAATPEDAFVQLEVARLRAEHLYGGHEVPLWVREQMDPEGGPYHEQFGEIWLHAPDRPVQDLTELDALASAIEDAFPAHPVADHARAMQVYASLSKGMREGRDEPSYEEAFETLVDIENPVLAEQAALRLIRMDRWHPRPDVALDVLAGIHGTTPRGEMALAEWAMDRAVTDGDWQRATEWQHRFEAALAGLCPPEDTSWSCEQDRAERTDGLARLVAFANRVPASWREAMTAAAWKCQSEAWVSHAGTSTATATWTDERWMWGEWDRPTGVARCLSSASIDGPTPPGGTAVEVFLTAR